MIYYTYNEKRLKFMENTVIGCTGIAHIALLASDFEKSVKFYTDGLGCKIYRKWQSGERTIALLELGGGQYIELFSNARIPSEREEQGGQLTHLALTVRDCKKAYERAIAFGAVSKKEPTYMELPSEPPIPVTLAFVYGPDKEQIEFFELK